MSIGWIAVIIIHYVKFKTTLKKSRLFLYTFPRRLFKQLQLKSVKSIEKCFFMLPNNIFFFGAYYFDKSRLQFIPFAYV